MNKTVLEKTVNRVFSKPRIADSLELARANILDLLEKYREIDVYTEILKETIDDLDEVIFFIKQYKEGLLK